MTRAIDAVTPALYFSRRERQVLECLSDAWSTKEISRKLRISLGAVYFHQSSIRRKLGLADDRALVRWAILHPVDVSKGITRDYGYDQKAA